MARLIRNTQKMNLGFRLSTVFENETVDREYKIGDVVENLRYVKDGDIEVVSGRITEIKYTMATRLTWNKKDPKDTLAKDMVINSLVLDVSEQYESKFVTVPAREIVEFEEEKDVVRMKYEPFVLFTMDLKYSDLTEQHVEISVGDTFDNVRIINLLNATTIGPDITGKFEVVGFSYAVTAGKFSVNGIAFKNMENGATIVANLDHILALNEVYSYDVDESNMDNVIANLGDGDTLTIGKELDTTQRAITITKQNVTLKLDADVVCNGSQASGLRVTGGSAVIEGDGLIVNTTPYDSTKGSGVVGINKDGELTFNGGGISAVIEDDPVNKGQFGITVWDNGKLTVNDGDFKAGWYCVSGNGARTNADSVTTINGGEFVSTADYAIYHPHAGKLIINGGVIKGAAGAIAANNGIIEINGGEFSVLGGGDTGNWSDGTSGLTDVALNLNARYGDVVCRITGGTFYATAAGTIMIKTGNNHTVDLKISGGNFTQKPNDEWIAEGYVCSETANAEGFYTVIAA